MNSIFFLNLRRVRICGHWRPELLVRHCSLIKDNPLLDNERCQATEMRKSCFFFVINVFNTKYIVAVKVEYDSKIVHYGCY